MDARRQRYLEHMGVDVWTLRQVASVSNSERPEVSLAETEVLDEATSQAPLLPTSVPEGSGLSPSFPPHLQSHSQSHTDQDVPPHIADDPYPPEISGPDLSMAPPPIDHAYEHDDSAVELADEREAKDDSVSAGASAAATRPIPEASVGALSSGADGDIEVDDQSFELALSGIRTHLFFASSQNAHWIVGASHEYPLHAQLKLLANIDRALGGDGQFDGELGEFRWPVFAQDKLPTASTAKPIEMLQAQLGTARPLLICMGLRESTWLKPLDHLGAFHESTFSLAELLEQPTRKAVTWQELSSLVSS